LGAAGVGANNIFPTFFGYYGVYHIDKTGDGTLRSYYELGRLDPLVGLIKFVEDDNPQDEMGNPIYPPSIPPEFPVDEDVMIQLDVFDPEIRFTVWAPGELQPEPQVIVADNSGYPFLTEGSAALVFNEDEYQGLEQGTGTFRWAKAAAALLLDGDMDVDGDVDFDDIDDFVLALNDPAAYELARGLPPVMQGDTDHDGDLDFDDIGNFVGALGGANGGGAAAGLVVPEPSTALLLLAGGLLVLVPFRKKG
jgi:hypothetical protein